MEISAVMVVLRPKFSRAPRRMPFGKDKYYKNSQSKSGKIGVLSFVDEAKKKNGKD